MLRSPSLSYSVFGLLALALFSACGPQVVPQTTLPSEGSPNVLLAPPEPTDDKAQEYAQYQGAMDIFERRCVVCHGCYDAPCQLVLSSFEGLARGANKEPVYQGSRLIAIAPTRLFIDGHTVEDWRRKGFFPVLQPTQAQAEAGQPDLRANLLLRMLELKRKHPMPDSGRFPRGFELGLDRESVCPRADEFEAYEKERPLWGMPYALPGLTDEEHAQLVAWVEAGAPNFAPPAHPEPIVEAIQSWEAFLNEPSLKSRLMARYVYEHLFLGSLYFSGLDERRFFRLVRSRTPPGMPIDEIPTRRPFEAPDTDTFYYRFARREGVVVSKTHMPYALSEARLARFRELFLEPEYEVKELPPYDVEISANPFRTFHDIPVRSRYRFMLEEAEFTMMGFIKGPVCRGQIALDVIQDRFWISFVNPDSKVLEAEEQFLSDVASYLDMPAISGSNASLTRWLRFSRNHKKFLNAKSKFLEKLTKEPGQVNLNVVWGGDEDNANAALTVFRHFDSATVVKGFVGEPPKTAWLVSYSILERIHYLLVAGFDVFGNIGHQLNTRMYMDFLRMESEHNFISLLPRSRRRKLVDMWYRDVKGSVKDAVYGQVAYFEAETDIRYRTQTPELELFEMLKEKYAPVLERRHNLEQHADAGTRQELERLQQLTGTSASLMPELSFLEVRGASGAHQYFTITRDSALTNVAELFNEDNRRVPKEDRLSVVPGFLGSYPNALFSVDRSELRGFVEMLGHMTSADSYMLLHARFGVSRTSPVFWQALDRMHAAFSALSPLEAGLFDLNRLEGR